MIKLNLSSLQLNKNQHAFTGKRSTVTAIANISQNWFNVTDNSNSAKEGVHALFIDFRNAFDLVDHGILLRKLAAMNVTKAFWLWIPSFLDALYVYFVFHQVYANRLKMLPGLKLHKSVHN